jgi:hypothetical protein
MTTMEVVMIDKFGSREVMKFRKTSDPDPRAERNPAEGKGREHQPDRLEDPRRPISCGQIRQAALRAGPRRIRRAGGLWHGNKRAPEGYAMLGFDRGAYAEHVIVKANEAAPKPRSIDHLASLSGHD